MDDKTTTKRTRNGGGSAPRAAQRRRVTMTDVARAAACSQSTVSFVLNNNTGVQISDATRIRVLRIAEDLGYQFPAPTGPSQRPGQEKRAIAFIVERFSVGWEGGTALLDGVRQAANASGALVLAAETDNDAQIEPQTIAYVLDAGVEAIIYACVHTRKVELPPLLQATSTPVYLLNCYTDDNARPAVVPSEIAGGQRATQTLIAAGHTRIATITGETYMEAAGDRLEGYRRALASADIPYDPGLVLPGDWSTSSGFRATQALLSQPQPPTAIFCQNDRMAVGAYEALKESGLKIPTDMSVVGYDDDEISRHLFPPLTTLVLPHRAMGLFVVEQHLEGRHQGGPRTKLECELVDRQSVAATKATKPQPAKRRRAKPRQATVSA